jgi:hypothetical protein
MGNAIVSLLRCCVLLYMGPSTPQLLLSFFILNLLWLMVHALTSVDTTLFTNFAPRGFFTQFPTLDSPPDGDSALRSYTAHTASFYIYSRDKS